MACLPFGSRWAARPLARAFPYHAFPSPEPVTTHTLLRSFVMANRPPHPQRWKLHEDCDLSCLVSLFLEICIAQGGALKT